MTFRRFGLHTVLYWCRDGHSSIVQVPRNRKPWERVQCPMHKLWMYQFHDQILDEQPQDVLERKE